MEKEIIGLSGSGADYELTVHHETAKAYLVMTWMGEKVWLPKTCFDEDGIITTSGYNLFLNKLEEGKK